MKLTINLATRRYLNMRRIDTALAVCFALLVILALFKVREAAHNEAERSRIQLQSAALDTRPGGVPVSETQLKALGTRIWLANAAIEKKSLNWIALLDRLEEVVPNGVALTQIEPVPKVVALTRTEPAPKGGALTRTEPVPKGEAVTPTEPGQYGEPVKITGVVRGFASLRELLENMERSKNFSEVYLLGQSETKVGVTQQGLIFNITCKVVL